MPNQQKTIEALKAEGLRDGVKVMIGGAPTTRAWADEIGADGYAEDAIEAVVAAKGLLGVAVGLAGTQPDELAERAELRARARLAKAAGGAP